MAGASSSRFRQWGRWLFTHEHPPNGLTLFMFGAGCASLTSAILGFHKYAEEMRADSRRREDQAIRKSIQTLTFEISEDKPRNRLVDLRLYKKSLRKKLPAAQKEAFRDDRRGMREHIADVWYKRRDNNDEDAIRIEQHRVALTAMWANVYRLYLSHHDKPRFKEALEGFVHDPLFLGSWVARRTIYEIEPLDKAIWRARGEVTWDEARPSVYDFIRDVFAIPDDWPDSAVDIDDDMDNY